MLWEPKSGSRCRRRDGIGSNQGKLPGRGFTRAEPLKDNGWSGEIVKGRNWRRKMLQLVQGTAGPRHLGRGDSVSLRGRQEPNPQALMS